MFDDLTGVALVGEDQAARPLYGTLPTGLDLSGLTHLFGDKPSLAKQGEDLLIAAPVVAGRWALWSFAKIPPVTDLPALVKAVGDVSRAVLKPGAAPAMASAAGGETAALSLLIQRFAGAGRLRRKGVLQTLANAVVEAEVAEAALAFPVSGRSVGRPVASDQSLLPLADEIRTFAKAARSSGTLPLKGGVDDLEEDGLDAALLCRSAGYDRLHLDLPEAGAKGYGLLLFNPTPADEAGLKALRDLPALALSQQLRKEPSFGVRLRRLAVAGALAGLAAFLAWPATFYITATGTSRPAEAVTAALHFDAFLAGMEVEVGDRVEEGAVLARFRAPDLEERRAEAALQVAVEEATAQSALAQNDLGAFVLAEQRIAAEQRRIDNIEARLERLELRAPVSGTVVAATSRGLTGSFVPTGEQVALIQEDQRFGLTLTFLRVDAPLIEDGQRGEVYFRGISGESFAFELTTQVLVEQNPETGEESLTARATILDDDQTRLLSGLSGYARIEAGTQPRILSYGRYAIEYIKVQAWTYLGLRW